jgi:hypothetical protein
MPAIKKSPALGYLRVSKRDQGRSGLGLAAQRQEIEAVMLHGDRLVELPQAPER